MIDVDRWQAAVLSDRRLGPRTKLVAQALAKYFREGTRVVTIATLMNDTGVEAAFGLRALHRFGWLISSGDDHHPLISASSTASRRGLASSMCSSELSGKSIHIE